MAQIAVILHEQKWMKLSQEVFCVIKGPILSLNLTPHQFWTKMYKHFGRIRHYSAKSSKIFKFCTISFYCWRTATVINNSEWNIFVQICSFVDGQFQFCLCRRFWTPIQYYDLGLFKFESESEIDNFQYHSYRILSSIVCTYKYSPHLNFTMILGHYLLNIKPSLRYLPSILRRQYFTLIFFEKSAQYTR